MPRALGTDDAVNACDCCGRANLKFTVVIELDDGDIVHYGQVCATRNTGKARPVLNAEIKASEQAARIAAQDEFAAHPARAAEFARFAERDRLAQRLQGMAAADFVRDAVRAADVACAEIVARHRGVRYWDVRA